MPAKQLRRCVACLLLWGLIPGIAPLFAQGSGQPLDRRILVWPESQLHLDQLALLGSDIELAADFGASKEYRATASAVANIGTRGFTSRELPGIGELYLREQFLLEPDWEDPVSHPLVTQFPERLHPVVLAMTGLWQDAWRDEIEANAVILGAVPPYGILVRTPAANLGTLLSLADITGVLYVQGAHYLEPEQRLAPRLGTSNVLDIFRAEILMYPGESESEVVGLVLANTGVMPEVSQVYGRTIVTTDLTFAQALQYAELPEVEWIDDWSPGESFNEMMRVLVQTDNSLAGANQAFYNPLYSAGIDGSTQAIAFADGGIYLEHEVFGAPDKILANYVPLTSPAVLGDEDGHGTSVACSAAGNAESTSADPYSDANGRDGIAYQAKIVMQDIGSPTDRVDLPVDWISELFIRAYNEVFDEQAVRVHSSSWGHGPSVFNPTAGAYSFRSQVLDELLSDPQYADLVSVFAVGNEGESLITGGYVGSSLSDEGHSKNVIAVGGHRNGSLKNVMYDFSGRGPTDDGVAGRRVKPDILGVGINLDTADTASPTDYSERAGTSSAAPCIAGAAALLRDWLEKGGYTGPLIHGEPSAALIKAMLVNSTVPLTDPSAFFGNTAAGLPSDGYPNFDQGYGRPVLDQVVGVNEYRVTALLQRESSHVATGERWSRVVWIPNMWTDAYCQSLRVTLVWSDPAAMLSAGKALVNDLDLEVIFKRRKYIGNALHLQNDAFDDQNNVEDVIVPILPGHNLGAQFPVKVIVRGTQVFSQEEQPFAVVVSFGSCPGALPCVATGCYSGPGDVIPGPVMAPDPCAQEYSTDPFQTGESDPFCPPPVVVPPFTFPTRAILEPGPSLPLPGGG